MKVDHWFFENQNEDVKFGIRVSEHLASVQSKYQKIDIVKNDFFGKVLFLDGCFMLTEKDEYFYQEMITHPAMVSHPHPKNVLIIGGGDGGVAREVLKHDIDRIDLVEIDEEVINLSKKFFPEIASSFDDKRVNIFNMDAFEFVNKTGNYDVIIVDSTDPIGFAASLFSEVFYEKASKLLGKEGILVTQTGSPFMNPSHIIKAIKGISANFNHYFPYLASVPTYPSGLWSYVMASNSPIFRRRKFTGKYYNDEVYDSLNKYPQFFKDIIEQK